MTMSQFLLFPKVTKWIQCTYVHMYTLITSFLLAGNVLVEFPPLRVSRFGSSPPDLMLTNEDGRVIALEVARECNKDDHDDHDDNDDDIAVVDDKMTPRMSRGGLNGTFVFFKAYFRNVQRYLCKPQLHINVLPMDSQKLHGNNL